MYVRIQIEDFCIRSHNSYPIKNVFSSQTTTHFRPPQPICTVQTHTHIARFYETQGNSTIFPSSCVKQCKRKNSRIYLFNIFFLLSRWGNRRLYFDRADACGWHLNYSSISFNYVMPFELRYSFLLVPRYMWADRTPWSKCRGFVYICRGIWLHRILLTQISGYELPFKIFKDLKYYYLYIIFI